MVLQDAYGPDKTALGSDSRGEPSDGSNVEPAGSEDTSSGRLGKPLDFMTVHKTVLTISITPKKIKHPVGHIIPFLGLNFKQNMLFDGENGEKKIEKVAVLP